MPQHFSNIEEFSNILKGYDIDLRQIDRGSFSATLQQIDCGSVFISRIATTRRMEANGNPPPGLRTFGIPTENCQPFVWRNQHSSGNTIQIYKPNTELEMVSHPLFEVIDVSITQEYFAFLNQQWGFAELDELISDREMLVCDPVNMQQLRNALRFICVTVDRNPDMIQKSTELQNLIQHKTPYLLAQALMTAEVPDIRESPTKRARSLIKAIDYIRATSLGMLSLHRFCRENGINERTLQRAFLDRYGVSPSYYVRALRLNAVHKDILRSDPGATRISDVASNNGFSHMSQFAKDYRRHFGELPSETMKSRR